MTPSCLVLFQYYASVVALKLVDLNPKKTNRKKGLEAPHCMWNMTEFLMSA